MLDYTTHSDNHWHLWLALNFYFSDMRYQRFIAFLFVVFLILLGFHLNAMHLHFDQGADLKDWWVRKFDFTAEKNAPSIFSTALLFLAGVILLWLSQIQKRLTGAFKMWMGLGLVFLFLAADELLRIHEKLNGVFKDLEIAETITYVWTIPYAIAGIVLLLMISKPLLQLPRDTFVRFAVAGFIFVFGAMGLELLAGSLIANAEAGYQASWELAVLSTIEESLEMIGVILFIAALLRHKVKYMSQAAEQFL